VISGTDVTPTRGSNSAEDKPDQPTCPAADWIITRNILVEEFGEDLAHFALLRLLIAQQRGQNIHYPLAWCWRVAQRRQWREDRQARRWVSMTEQVREELWDLVTPERRVIARDLLAHAHPYLVAQLFGKKTTVSPRMRTHWRAKLRALADA
jgi:hypothetical protein